MIKALGPWPILQFTFVVIVAVFGAFMFVRGTIKKDEGTVRLEDKRAEWLAYEHLRNIEENSFKSVELQRQTKEAIERLVSVIWNRESR